MVPPAVFLDAMGTLVQLERPWPRLARALAARGVTVSEQQAREAMLAEIAFYRLHLHEAADPDGLRDLRRRCAAVLAGALGEAVSQLGPDAMVEVMLESLRFSAYPEVSEVLTTLRGRGHRLFVVSNWDISLHEVLRATGLTALIDGAVVSAEVRAAKPDPRIFELALGMAGADAADAVHVGDSEDADVAGARAAGIRAVFVDRDEGGGRVVEGATVIPDLRGLLSLLA
jgi:putative hydrolase of the HAD superfamily